MKKEQAWCATRDEAREGPPTCPFDDIVSQLMLLLLLLLLLMLLLVLLLLLLLLLLPPFKRKAPQATAERAV